MNVKDLIPILWTEDFDGTLEFYQSVFGAEVDELNAATSWATLRLDLVPVMISRPNEHTPYGKIGFSGSFYFTTNNVEEWWAKLKDKARVCYGIEDFEYGMREFAVFDNNGYLIQFGQPTEN